jgi:hypothetical protein
MSMHRQTLFALKRPDWRPPPPGDGLAASLTPDAVTAWADYILCADHGFTVWDAVGAAAERCGIRALRRCGVRAVTLMPASADARYADLGLRFAAHLTAQRAHWFGTRPSLTSWDWPTPPRGWLRVPHLLSITNPGRSTDVLDTVIWELIDEAAATEWIGGPLPDLPFFEAHLAGLVALRAAARTGQLPATHAGQRLQALLRDQELSTRLVYRQPDLFRVLLAQRALDPDVVQAGPSIVHDARTGDRVRG